MWNGPRACVHVNFWYNSQKLSIHTRNKNYQFYNGIQNILKHIQLEMFKSGANKVYNGNYSLCQQLTLALNTVFYVCAICSNFIVLNSASSLFFRTKMHRSNISGQKFWVIYFISIFGVDEQKKNPNHTKHMAQLAGEFENHNYGYDISLNGLESVTHQLQGELSLTFSLFCVCRFCYYSR